MDEDDTRVIAAIADVQMTRFAGYSVPCDVSWSTTFGKLTASPLDGADRLIGGAWLHAEVPLAAWQPEQVSGCP